MPTNEDSFVITSAMIAYVWVKPATTYYTGTGETNATSDYTPRTLAEKAGAVGGAAAAVSTDPNHAFARTMKDGTPAAPAQGVPYPTGLPGDVTSSDVVAAVECNATVSVPTVPTSPQ